MAGFDTAGLEAVVLASFDAGGATTLWAASGSPWGASGTLVEGDVVLDGDTSLIRVMVPNADGSLLRLNDGDGNGSDGVLLRDFFAQSGAGGDLTVWVRTAAGTASFAASGVNKAGRNYVNFNVPVSERSVLAGISAGDRFVLALTRPAPTPPTTTTTTTTVPTTTTYDHDHDHDHDYDDGTTTTSTVPPTTTTSTVPPTTTTSTVPPTTTTTTTSTVPPTTTTTTTSTVPGSDDAEPGDEPGPELLAGGGLLEGSVTFGSGAGDVFVGYSRRGSVGSLVVSGFDGVRVTRGFGRCGVGCGGAVRRRPGWGPGGGFV